MKKRQIQRVIIFLATIAFVTAGTFAMIHYAKGYRPTIDGTVKGTGLLAANSFPPGAELYINDRLRSATDTTLNLDPGTYDVKISKDGYFTWEKKLEIQEELVTQTNAALFPMSPTLQPLTFTGAISPIPAPNGQQIVYAVASASASTKNGLYIQDLTSSPISISRSDRQIARTTSGYDYAKAKYTWSPNGSQILVSFSENSNLLLDANKFNDIATLKDVTSTLPTTFQEWEQELARSEKTKLNKYPPYFQDMLAQEASGSATQIANLYLSPDGEKLLYQGSDDFTLPEGLLPPLPSSSTQPENRVIQKGSWYVYDLKEDKNFLIGPGTLPDEKEEKEIISKLSLVSDIKDMTPAELGSSSPSAFTTLQKEKSIMQSIGLFNAQYASIYIGNAQWYSDSYHLIVTSDAGIDMVEYDATNRTTVYAGPFDSSFVYPWPDGSKLITKIQFSPDTIPNLYTIKLK